MCVTQELWVIKPVPDPEAKLSSSEITNPTSITASYNTRMIWWSVLSCVQLFVTPWTGAHQAPLSMGFPRQETLEWVAISCSRRSPQARDQTSISCVSILSWSVFVEKEMATHSSILAWGNLMDRGTWQATVPRGCKELGMTEWLHTHTHTQSVFVPISMKQKNFL